MSAGEELRKALAEGGALRRNAPVGVYLHVPYCASRCGYCDFNTYTARELGPGVNRESWLADVSAEMRLASQVLGNPRAQSTDAGVLGMDPVRVDPTRGNPAGVDTAGVDPAGVDTAGVDPAGVDTVFFGGGTPTLLPPETLVAALAEVNECFGLAAGAEVTTEANPESVDEGYLATLREGGFTRISIGMQSTAASVLRVLDRQHSPRRALDAARAAQSVGFEHVSLDLIYGTPGESDSDWRASLQAAVDAGVDHVSAYALTVEQGTALAGKVARGVVPAPDPDVAAERYEAAEEILTAAGMRWYEISNFAKTGGQCRHNLHYWRNDDWWGLGPGAHSHVGGVRWWNVKHPRAYAECLGRGELPVAGFEVLDEPARQLEQLMLQLRLREGLPLAGIPKGAVHQLVTDGLVTIHGDRVVLTLRGRLLADRVTLVLAG